MNFVRRDYQALARADLYFIVAEAEAKPARSHISRLHMRMIVAPAFCACFEPERNHHKVGVFSQDLAGYARIGRYDRKSLRHDTFHSSRSSNFRGNTPLLEIVRMGPVNFGNSIIQPAQMAPGNGYALFDRSIG